MFKKYYFNLVNTIKNNYLEISDVNNISKILPFLNKTFSFHFELLCNRAWIRNNVDVNNNYIINNPVAFKQLIGMRNPDFNNYSQQDAHECIMTVFDMIEHETGCDMKVNVEYTQTELTAFITVDKCLEELSDYIGFDSDGYQNKRASLRVLEDNFQGLMKRRKQLLFLINKYEKKYSICDELFSIGQINVLECSNCEYKSINYDTNLFLFAEIPDPNEDTIQQKINTLVSESFKSNVECDVKKPIEHSIKSEETKDRFSQEEQELTDNLSSLLIENLRETSNLNSSTIQFSNLGNKPNNKKPVYYDLDVLDNFNDLNDLDDTDLDDNLEESDDDTDLNREKAYKLLGIDKNNKEEQNDIDIFLNDSDEELTKIIKNKDNMPVVNVEEQRRKHAIELLQKETKVTLEECLKQTFRVEKLEDKHSCNYCRQKNDFTKTNSLWDLPEYLIIQLKRFENISRTKKQQLVLFNQLLDVEQFMDPDLLEHLKTNTTYNLTSIINHSGSMNNGHYFTYSKNMQDEQWYENNDTRVIPCTDIITSNAYILVYEKNKDIVPYNEQLTSDSEIET